MYLESSDYLSIGNINKEGQAWRSNWGLAKRKTYNRTT